MTAKNPPTTTIGEALADPRLLGAALGPTATWTMWLIVLRAAFGEQLTDDELVEFARVAGSRVPPAQRVRELWCIVGRRGGKSRVAAAVVVFIALFLDHSKLAPGETGHVVCLSASMAQAELIRSYCLGFLAKSPILRQHIVNSTGTEIVLRDNITISVLATNFRSIRGRTILAAVFDESAFWRDETSASPDVETYRAVMPSLVASGGMLVGISSPYRRLGLVHAKHQHHFGKDDADVLVVQGASKLFNPTIDQALIAKAYEDDPEAAASEWGAEWRRDLAALLDDGIIDAAIEHSRPLELPPRRDVRYFAFADPSGGRHDAFTLCCGHLDVDKRFICDVIRGRAPPFDPQEVVNEYSALCRSYGLRELTGDAYSASWCQSAHSAAKMTYHTAKLAKSGIYLESLPMWNRGMVSIPNIPQLVRELRLLERRTHRSGKDSVDHGSNGSDDFANAVCGAMWVASGAGRRGEFGYGVFNPYGGERGGGVYVTGSALDARNNGCNRGVAK